MKYLLAVLVVLGLMLLIGIPAIAITGFTVSVLWNWFIAPLGAPAISSPAGMGIAVIVWVLTYRPEDKEAKTLDQIKTMLITWALMPIGALLTGYIIQLFL